MSPPSSLFLFLQKLLGLGVVVAFFAFQISTSVHGSRDKDKTMQDAEKGSISWRYSASRTCVPDDFGNCVEMSFEATSQAEEATPIEATSLAEEARAAEMLLAMEPADEEDGEEAPAADAASSPLTTEPAKKEALRANALEGTQHSFFEVNASKEDEKNVAIRGGGSGKRVSGNILEYLPLFFVKNSEWSIIEDIRQKVGNNIADILMTLADLIGNALFDLLPKAATDLFPTFGAFKVFFFKEASARAHINFQDRNLEEMKGLVHYLTGAVETWKTKYKSKIGEFMGRQLTSLKETMLDLMKRHHAETEAEQAADDAEKVVGDIGALENKTVQEKGIKFNFATMMGKMAGFATTASHAAATASHAAEKSIAAALHLSPKDLLADVQEITNRLRMPMFEEIAVTIAADIRQAEAKVIAKFIFNLVVYLVGFLPLTHINTSAAYRLLIGLLLPPLEHEVFQMPELDELEKDITDAYHRWLVDFKVVVLGRAKAFLVGLRSIGNPDVTTDGGQKNSGDPDVTTDGGQKNFGVSMLGVAPERAELQNKTDSDQEDAKSNGLPSFAP